MPFSIALSYEANSASSVKNGTRDDRMMVRRQGMYGIYIVTMYLQTFAITVGHGCEALDSGIPSSPQPAESGRTPRRNR